MGDSLPRGFGTPPFSLPSVQRTIFHLAVRIMETREDLRMAEKCFDHYLHDLPLSNSWKAGDSVVRSFENHDGHKFSIEPQATRYVRLVPLFPERWSSALLFLFSV